VIDEPGSCGAHQRGSEGDGEITSWPRGCSILRSTISGCQVRCDRSGLIVLPAWKEQPQRFADLLDAPHGNVAAELKIVR